MLIAPFVVIAYASSTSGATVVQGFLLGVVAIATLAWWNDRLRGKTERSPRQWLAGRLALLVAVGFGYATLIPEVLGALGVMTRVGRSEDGAAVLLVNERTRWTCGRACRPTSCRRALTVFNDDRARIWRETSHPDVYRVHELGPDWADVTEGVPYAWSRERYDWSEPGIITLRQLDSNIAVPSEGLIEYRIEADGSGSLMRCDRRRTFRPSSRRPTGWHVPSGARCRGSSAASSPRA